jgi:hypothetical protein
MMLALLGLIPALFGMAAQDSSQPRVVRRVTVQDEVIISIPVRPRPKRPQNFEWKEEKGRNASDRFGLPVPFSPGHLPLISCSAIGPEYARSWTTSARHWISTGVSTFSRTMTGFAQNAKRSNRG